MSVKRKWEPTDGGNDVVFNMSRASLKSVQTKGQEQAEEAVTV